MNETISIVAKGHVTITDDLGNVLLDKDNAIHPRNLSRIIARALANEPNSSIYRIAFGNGGTSTDASFNITYEKPKDGLPPNDTQTWDSRLYNETYSEVIDDSSSLLGQDLGSSDSSGTRTGGGTNESGDAGTGVVSIDLGNTSDVAITAVINKGEPIGQLEQNASADGAFVFDELGLYSSGASASDTVGYTNIDVGTKNAADSTGLNENSTYSFRIKVNNSTNFTQITFQPPIGSGSGASGEILYSDLVNAINSGDTSWNGAWTGSPLPVGSVVRITDESDGTETFGFLQFASGTTGENSAVEILEGTAANSNDLIASLNGDIQSPVPGAAAGVQNDSSNPTRERERLLTHLIFEPVFKSFNRQIIIKYAITFALARTSE